MYYIELSFIQLTLVSIIFDTIHLYVIIFYRNCISYNLISFYYILYCIILYRLYFIQWNLIILFYPQPCFSKLYCVQSNLTLYNGIRLYCILWHHAQLILYNVILSHSIVMIINLIQFNRAYYLFDCVQFNFRLSYCRVAFFYVYFIAYNIISCNLIVLCKIHLFELYGVFICSMIDYT